jgi:hypothetical protein
MCLVGESYATHNCVMNCHLYTHTHTCAHAYVMHQLHISILPVSAELYPSMDDFYTCVIVCKRVCVYDSVLCSHVSQ